MAFFRWKTDWDDYKAHCGRDAEFKDEQDFWPWRQRQVARHGGSLRNEAELMWIKAGKPYYNVHPNLVDKFCRVNLEKIPSHLVEVPHYFNAVNVRLSESHPEFTMTELLPATQESAWSVPDIPEGAYIRSILMIRPTALMLRAYKFHTEHPENYVMFYMDCDVVSEHGTRTMVTAPLLWYEENETLNDSIDTIGHIMKGKSEDYRKIVENCMRICVTIGFLANSKDAMVEYDVLAKDRDKFHRGDGDTRKRLATKARRRGKIGYNIGNEMMFLGEQPIKGSSGSTGEGRELQYSHIRGGHPHAVRYGPGRKKVRIDWFRPTRVREDLPFKPEED